MAASRSSAQVPFQVECTYIWTNSNSNISGSCCGIFVPRTVELAIFGQLVKLLVLTKPSRRHALLPNARRLLTSEGGRKLEDEPQSGNARIEQNHTMTYSYSS
jgi:hypothetical protein